MFGETNNSNTNGVSSPIAVYLEFKKLDKANVESTKFCMYSKEEGENIAVNLGAFIVISDGFRLEMYDRKTNKFYKSNIVNIDNLRDEDMVLEINGKGVYNQKLDFSDKPAGAKLNRILTVNHGGILTRITLSSSSSQEFAKAFGEGKESTYFSQRYTNYIEVAGTEKRESTMGDYMVATFKLGEPIKAGDREETLKLAEKFGEYVDSFSKPKED